jgi:hypothetical protein
MSSETSTENSARLVPPKRERAEADALQPWQLFTLAGLIGATIVVFMSRGQTKAGIILLSLIVFAAAFVGLAALRTFLPFAGILIDGGADIVGGRTRAALEREKMLLLRFIKDLEFDRRMGKVSEKDFAEMSARLRSRAARLIRQLDAGSLYREQIEREIVRRLAGLSTRDSGLGARNSSGVQSTPVMPAGSRGADPASRIPDPESPPAASEVAAPVTRSGPAECSACSAQNDSDAKFCKNCGARLEVAS